MPNTRHDILCFSTIDWDFIWQGHQEIMSTFARQGHRVLFVENTGVRGPRLRDFARIRSRYQKWQRSTHGFWQVEKNLHVYSPLVLPFPYSRWARWINRRRMVSDLRHWMEVTEFHSPVCWTFLPTPLTLDVIHRIPHKLLIYYCIDSFADSTPAAGRIIPSEESLMKEADLVFVTSQSLFDKAARFNSRVHLFPFGVSFEKFIQAGGEPNGLPEELKEIRAPRIGYIGGIHQWIDQELLAQTARSHPELAFVMIGPEQVDATRLKQEPNIHLLGQKPHSELPIYIKHFDAGIIPYRLTDYTNNVYPTKLNEYHALGVPVVSTPLPEVLSFNEKNARMVRIGGTPGEFGRELKEALRLGAENGKQERVQAAQANAWSRKINDMKELIRETISEKEASRPNHWAVRLREAFGTRLALKTGLALLLAGLLIFQTPLAWLLAEPLRVKQQLRLSDAIVVFAGGVGEAGEPGESYQERVQQAIRLYQQGYAPMLVLVSGDTWTFDEVDVMRALAKDLGVPPEKLITEEAVSNTADYVRQVGRLAQTQGWKSVLLVTSPYHSRRALLTFRKLAPGLQVSHASEPVSRYYDRSGQRGITPEQLKSLLHEAAGILFYCWKGWI